MKIKNVSKENLSGIDTFVNGVECPMKAGETIEMPDDLAGILIRRLDPKVINASLEKSREEVDVPKVEPKKVEPKIEKKVETKKAGRPKKSK
jgi:hypothetical protein